MRLELIASENNYSFRELTSSDLRTKLSGGLDETRMDLVGTINLVNVEYVVGRNRYRYFQNFYKQWLRNPVWFDAFLVGYVKYEDYPWANYKCAFVSDGVKTDEISGSRYRISCQMLCYYDINNDPTSMLYPVHSIDCLSTGVTILQGEKIGRMPWIEQLNVALTLREVVLRDKYQKYTRYPVEYAQTPANPIILSGTLRSLMNKYTKYPLEYSQTPNNPIVLSGTVRTLLVSYSRYPLEFSCSVNNPSILSGTLV